MGAIIGKAVNFTRKCIKKVSFYSLSSLILALAWAHCSSGIRRSEKRYKKFYKFKITSVEMIKYFHNNFFTLFLPNDEEASDDVNKFFTPPFINFSFNAEWLATRTLNYCTTSYFLFYLYFLFIFGMDGWMDGEKVFHFCFMPSPTWKIQLRLTKIWQKFSPNFTHRIFMVVAANIIFHVNALQTFSKDLSHSLFKIYRGNCERTRERWEEEEGKLFSIIRIMMIYIVKHKNCIHFLRLNNDSRLSSKLKLKSFNEIFMQQQ